MQTGSARTGRPFFLFQRKDYLDGEKNPASVPTSSLQSVKGRLLVEELKERGSKVCVPANALTCVRGLVTHFLLNSRLFDCFWLGSLKPGHCSIFTGPSVSKGLRGEPAFFSSSY